MATEHPSWKYMVAGASGGVAAILVTNPLDIIRTRLQSTHTPHAQSSCTSHAAGGIRREFFRIWRGTGPGFTCGLAASLLCIIPTRAVYFLAYNKAKAITGPRFGERVAPVLSGLTAALTANIATHPMWTVKTLVQVEPVRLANAGQAHSGDVAILHVVRSVWAKQGYRGFYAGLGASLLGMFETATYWSLYEFMKRSNFLAQSDPDPQQKVSFLMFMTNVISASGISKLISSMIWYPHEVLRTRMRDGLMTSAPRRKFVDTVRTIWQVDGPRGMWGGLTTHLPRQLLFTVTTFSVYESVLRRLVEVDS